MEGTLVNTFFFIFGASIGSFLNVLADRLPNNRSIMGRSSCDHCGKKIAWYDLFPIFSFIFLGGRCRYCRKKLSFQYPLVEILTGASFLLIIFFGQASSYIQLFAELGIISALIVIFVSDLKYHLISDYILIAFAVFSAIYKLSGGGVWQLAIKDSIIASLLVALPIFLIYFISREKAMGLGDVYLAVIMGFLLGLKGGYMALYIAFVTGAIIGSFLIIRYGKKVKRRIAFGPFLVIGTVVMLVWGDKILGIIKKIYGF